MNHIEAQLTWGGVSRVVDFSRPIDISLSLKDSRNHKGASAWYVDGPRFEAVRGDGFVGRVSEGGSVNFTDVYFNPHGHGTHTECLGHITREFESIDNRLRENPVAPLVICLVHTITPEVLGEDLVILPKHLPNSEVLPEAFAIRTTPNDESKQTQTWDNTNPPYLDPEFTSALVERGVKHLLIDLPSVDREVDGGALVSHRVFFGVPDAPRDGATITEFIYIENRVSDGLYALNLQVAPMDLDASPSRPVLFPLK